MSVADDPHQGFAEQALISDPPANRRHPAATMAEAIPSCGVNLNAVLYRAAGPELHPTVLLLHGLPGNEQNIDLAQSMRRAGWNVLTFHYRGSWGTPGRFSFAHCLEDAAAALDWLLEFGGGANLLADPSRIIVIGHSVGGHIAARLAAGRVAVHAVALLSPANIASAFGLSDTQEALSRIDENVGRSEGLHILSGTSPETLATEARENASQWMLENHAPDLASRPVLLVTSDDGFTSGSDGLASGLRSKGNLTAAHISTDHSYSGCRIALQREVLGWLAELPIAPPL